MKTTVLNLYDDRQDVTLTAYILSDSPELLNGQSTRQCSSALALPEKVDWMATMEANNTK